MLVTVFFPPFFFVCVKTAAEWENLQRESPSLHRLKVLVPLPWAPCLLDLPVTLKRVHPFILNMKLHKVMLHILPLRGMTKYDFGELVSDFFELNYIAFEI